MASLSLDVPQRSTQPSSRPAGLPVNSIEKIHLVAGRDAAPANRKILNSWKEIATYMGRGVRTLQRYERMYRLPIRRPAGKNRSAVMALSDEIDTWLASVPTRQLGYVRPVLVILDSPIAGRISERKIALENAYFNVLTALNMDEAYATAEKFDVDGFVFDCGRADEISLEMCESLKDRFPKKPLFVLAPASSIKGKSPRADQLIPAGDLPALVDAVVSVLGSPRIE